jgi:hypothetical protein
MNYNSAASVCVFTNGPAKIAFQTFLTLLISLIKIKPASLRQQV